MARWLETAPSVLLLDEPTQGVDVGARRDIFQRIVAAAQAGATVLYTTSETQDLAELCHRVLVFRDGLVTRRADRGRRHRGRHQPDVLGRLGPGDRADGSGGARHHDAS